MQNPNSNAKRKQSPALTGQTQQTAASQCKWAVRMFKSSQCQKKHTHSHTKHIGIVNRLLSALNCLQVGNGPFALSLARSTHHCRCWSCTCSVVSFRATRYARDPVQTHAYHSRIDWGISKITIATFSQARSPYAVLREHKAVLDSMHSSCITSRNATCGIKKTAYSEPHLRILRWKKNEKLYLGLLSL
jgi:hypothetical protein